MNNEKKHLIYGIGDDEMKRIQLIAILLVFTILGSGCDTEENLRKSALNTENQDVNGAEKICSHNGQDVSEGTRVTRTMFQAEQVNYGRSCVSQEQTGTCDGGELIWAGSFTHPECTVAAFAFIEAGPSTVCALDTLGAAYCWGDNTDGQIGDGSQQQRPEPTKVAGNHIFTSISAGWFHNCGLTADGTAYCWGNNQFGQQGNGTTFQRSEPVAVTTDHAFTSISASRSHTCALKEDGSAYCWGTNSFVIDEQNGTTISGALGDGTDQERLVPTAVTGGYSFSSIATMRTSSCGLTAEGITYCWGGNFFGELGIGTTGAGNSRNAPTLVESGGLRFSSISSEGNSICGLTVDGVAFCWGTNRLGQFADGNGIDQESGIVTQVSGGMVFSAISTGGFGSCGLTADGSAYCWGAAFEGRLGNGSFNAIDDREFAAMEPVKVLGEHVFTSINATTSNTCALKENGPAYCWGAGGRGKIGDGLNADRTQPTKVLETNNPSAPPPLGE